MSRTVINYKVGFSEPAHIKSDDTYIAGVFNEELLKQKLDLNELKISILLITQQLLVFVIE